MYRAAKRIMYERIMYHRRIIFMYLVPVVAIIAITAMTYFGDGKSAIEIYGRKTLTPLKNTGVVIEDRGRA